MQIISDMEWHCYNLEMGNVWNSLALNFPLGCVSSHKLDYQIGANVKKTFKQCCSGWVQGSTFFYVKNIKH